MKRWGLLIVLLLCFHTIVFSQYNSYGKFSAGLKLLLADSTAPSRFLNIKHGIKTLSLVVKTKRSGDGYVLRKQGYALRTIMGRVATLDIPVTGLSDFARNTMIERIELPLLLEKQGGPDDTLMRRFTTVQQVRDGLSPLDKSYRGDGTVIGIIDDGADISHPEFYGEAGLRIRYLWNMDYGNGKPPEGFNYGTEWISDSMERYADEFKNKKLGIYQMQKLFGYAFHGTSVTSLAAGNHGVAPNATIVSVALTATIDNLLGSDRVIDGIAYIYRIAQQQNKKCIINISLGTTWGAPHDGKSLLETAIDDFCNEHPDVIVCTSAGNSGNDWKHWGGFPINKDSSFGFFRCSGQASLYITVPRRYSKTLHISVGESKYGSFGSTNISPDSVYYQTPYLNVDSLIASGAPAQLTSYLKNGQLSSEITFAASHYNDDYDELILTTYEHTSSASNLDEHLYRFIFKGEGLVHAWYPFWNLHPVYFFGDNPYPNDSTYHSTDNDYSTGIPTNAFTVVSSGAYNIRTCYVNMHNKYVGAYEKCRTAYFTSHGPTLDGRIKPDVITPGDNVFAARSRFDDFYDFDFIIDSNTVAFGGTSASSPITAGIAALIWQKFPNYTRNEVVQLLKQSANFDSYCSSWGTQPNNIAGWGKVDAFNALTGVPTDNSDLCTQGDDCVVKVIPGDSVPDFSTFYLIVYPNPVGDVAHIFYRSDLPLKYFLYDVVGRPVKTGTLPVSRDGNSVPLNMMFSAKGIYFLKVTGQRKPFRQKIIFAGK